MEQQRNIYVAGNYIAEQHIESQFIGGTHTHVEQIVREIRPLTVEADEAACSEKEQAQPRFALLTAQCIQEGKAEAVEAELRSAANGSAAKLVAVIRTNEALGYLDTKNMSSQALYDALNAYFGLKYSVRNFTKYRH